MLKFEKITLENIKLLVPFFKAANLRLCEYTIGVKWMWRSYFETEFLIYQDTLIIKENYEQEQCCFYYPLGLNVEEAFRQIDAFVACQDLRLEFCCLDEVAVKDVKKRYPNSDVRVDRKWSDYLYSFEDLATYKGKKMSGQRNHVNKFVRLYKSHIFSKAALEDIPRIQVFMEQLMKVTAKTSEEFIHETKVAYQMITDCFVLNLPCYYLEIDGSIAGFTIGEVIGDTLFVHVEKSDHTYAGINAFLVQSFVNVFSEYNLLYVNREDDCGDLGLRTAKSQYHPLELLAKHFVRLVKEKIIIETPRVIIREIMPEDKKDFYLLNTDKSSNIYWGYDYMTDVLEDDIIDENYFYDIVIGDYITKTAFSYMICHKESKNLIGEVILHNFADNEVEIGIRLFEKYQKQGFAFEVFSEMIMHCLNNLKSKVVAKCFKNNEASYRMLSKLLEKVREDETFYYFVREL